MPSNPMVLITTHMLMITKSPALNSYTQSRLISQLSIQHLPLGCLIENLTSKTLPPTPGPNLFAPSFSLHYLSTRSLYQRLTPKIWKAFLITPLFLHNPQLLNPSANPSKYIHNHHFLWPHPHVGLTTSSHLYAKIVHLCLQFILNIATRVIPLRHKSIILLLYSKSSNSFPSAGS